MTIQVVEAQVGVRDASAWAGWVQNGVAKAAFPQSPPQWQTFDTRRTIWQGGRVRLEGLCRRRWLDLDPV